MTPMQNSQSRYLLCFVTSEFSKFLIRLYWLGFPQMETCMSASRHQTGRPQMQSSSRGNLWLPVNSRQALQQCPSSGTMIQIQRANFLFFFRFNMNMQKTQPVVLFFSFFQREARWAMAESSEKFPCRNICTMFGTSVAWKGPDNHLITQMTAFLSGANCYFHSIKPAGGERLKYITPKQNHL